MTVFTRILQHCSKKSISASEHRSWVSEFNTNQWFNRSHDQRLWQMLLLNPPPPPSKISLNLHAYSDSMYQLSSINSFLSFVLPPLSFNSSHSIFSNTQPFRPSSSEHATSGLTHAWCLHGGRVSRTWLLKESPFMFHL